MNDIRGIYFDLDDTLCAYWDASKRAMRETFAELPVRELGPEEMVAAWAIAFKAFAKEIKSETWYDLYLENGAATRIELMRRMLGVLDVEYDTLARQLGDRYGELRNTYLELFPEALQIILDLHSNFPLGLMTNGPADVQRQEIERLQIEKYFQVILIEGEMKEGKPRRSVFERAEKLMGLEASQLLMVGNSFAHDIAPALSFGWSAFWIRRPSDVAPSATGPEEMPPGAPQPTKIIHNLDELMPILLG